MAIEIPREKLTVRFVRSGGPGGQNVNKVATKAEVRFSLVEADWIPPQVRARLAEQRPHVLTRAGELVISSDRFRSQPQNLEDCLARLRSWLAAAARPPKPRVATKPTRGSQHRKLEAKRRRGDLKRDRGWRSEE